MSLTHNPVLITDAIIAALEESDDLLDVFYGHENIIARSPAATVSTDQMVRQLYATGEMTQNEIAVEIQVHYSEAGRSEMDTRSCELLAVSLIPLLEADRTLGGLVIHGFVSSITPVGRVRNGSKLLKSGQLTYTAKSRTRIGV